MEDFRKHVKNGLATTKNGIPTSFCGEDVSMLWVFTEPTHAVTNNQIKGRLLPCVKCRDILIEILRSE